MLRGEKLYITFTTLLALIFGGTLMFHRLEDWTWIESFYFTVATLTTVGYGDIAPSNDTTRLFTAIFILIGVTIALTALSTVGSSYFRARDTRNQSISAKIEARKK